MTSLNDTIFNLEVNEDLELENFKAFCEVESGIPSAEVLIAFNGVPLTDGAKSLKVSKNHYLVIILLYSVSKNI